jgi:hypothetical protein
MADFQINTGTGPFLSMDVVGTANVQKIKFVVGGSGTATAVVFGQTAMADSFPVTIASDQSAVPVSGSVSISGTGTVIFGATQAVTAANVTIASITTGSVSVVGGPTFYVPGAAIASGTGLGGPMFIGIQSGATLGRGVLVTTTGSPIVTFAGTPAVTAADVTIASITTGTVSISGAIGTVSTVLTLPTITVGTVSNILTVGTLLGTVAVSGGGGGVQYTKGDTGIGATGTGTIFFGINATTATPVKVDAAGAVSVSGGGGGVQYAVAGDVATGTGTLFIGVQSGETAGRAVLLTTTGSPIITFAGTQAVTAAGVTIASITTGTVNVATGLINISGTVPVTLVSVSTVSTVGALLGTSNFIMVSGTITTGTVTIDGTSTVTVVGTPAVTAANVTIASITTGSVSVVGGPTFFVPGAVIASGTGLGGPMMIGIQSGATLGRGVLLTTTGSPLITFAATQPVSAALIAGTTQAGSLFATAHPTAWSTAVIATTSAAAGIVVKVSGAHTLYITDLMVNVAGPMTVTICSETTPKMYLVGLATNGGFALNQTTPIPLATAESLRVVCGSSGSCSVFAAGYTVT